MTPPSIIQDQMRAVVAATSASILSDLQEVDEKIEGVFFECGHWIEIQETLWQKTKANATVKRRYPLIALIEDVTIDRRNSKGFYGTVGPMRLIIAHQTSQSYKSSERDEFVFGPILYPIYNEFLNQLYYASGFSVSSPEEIPHRVTPRKRWGKEGTGGNTVNQGTDFIDALDIQDLSLIMEFKNCSFPINS